MRWESAAESNGLRGLDLVWLNHLAVLHMAQATIALTMSAQPFNGVTIGGSVNRPTILNQSDKPVIGYAVQRITTTGINPVSAMLNLNSLATGKPMQPGEERWLGLFSGFRSNRLQPGVGSTSGDEGEPVSYELKAVLFADGTFFGPEEVFLDFSGIISTMRSLARDTQYAAQDKYWLLEQDKQAMPQAILDALRKGAHASQEFQELDLRMQMSNVLLGIRDRKGDDEVDAALGRIAALPDVVRLGD